MKEINEMKNVGKQINDWIAREVAKAPVPPDNVLTRTITQRDIMDYGVYFIWGPGHEVASRTDCGHGYMLTDSCPCCDSN